jgi:hypothetical protein
MENLKPENEDINKNEDEISAKEGDENATSLPANDGFKTGNQSNGMTWEMPLDEQAFDDEDLSKGEEQSEEG